MKHKESHGCLKPSYVPGLPYGLCLGKLGSVRRGPKVIKSRTKTILETVNALYSTSVGAIIFICDTLYQLNIHCYIALNFHQDIT